jgi:hypothetical protein
MDGVAEIQNIDPRNLDPDTLLSRKDTGRALRECGYPVADSSLETMAVRGGGPPFQKFGRRAIYTWGTTRDWAENRLTTPVRSTSELKAVSCRAPPPDHAGIDQQQTKNGQPSKAP